MNPNLNQISSQDLDLRLKKLVATERKILHHILECINEVDLRKLYLSQSYPSLYDYLTKGVGYTPASAMRRIDAARLMRQVPEISQKIEAGEINLSQVSVLQKTIREVEKTTQSKISTETKKEILNKIANTNTQQTEVIIARSFNLEVPPISKNQSFIKIQNHQDESQSLTMHFSKEEIEILNQARDLVSNSTQSSSLKEALLYLAKKEIQKRDQYQIKKTKTTSVAEVSPGQYRKSLLKPGACCEYINLHTKNKCQSTKFLNVDHIKPKWAGGQNNLQNLRVLCSAHNKYRYQIQAGLI